MEAQLITAEIPYKGIGYLFIRECPAAELAGAMAESVDKLRAAGAKQVFVSSTDPKAPLGEGAYAGVELRFVHDMLVMERELFPLPDGAGLTAADLTPEGRALWLALYNQGFLHVPNGATYTERELDGALADGMTCGFFLREGEPVGIYELDLTGELPAVEGVALGDGFRGQGMGRALMRAALERIAAAGAERCKLEVSTANPVARRLYESIGFQTVRTRSRWFEAVKAV